MWKDDIFKEIKLAVKELIQRGKLIRHLESNQGLCKECQGYGIVITSNEFHSCRTCYGTGIMNICNFCNEQYKSKCKCDEAFKLEVKEFEDKSRFEEEKRFKSAKKYKLSEIKDDVGCLTDNSDIFIKNENIEDYQEELKGRNYLYMTKTCSFGLDIDNIIDSLVEEMYEDAKSHLDYSDLEDAVDEFNKKNRESLVVYWPDHKNIVLINE